jgi:methyl-accepting chemotaxis protein
MELLASQPCLYAGTAGRICQIFRQRHAGYGNSDGAIAALARWMSFPAADRAFVRQSLLINSCFLINVFISPYIFCRAIWAYSIWEFGIMLFSLLRISRRIRQTNRAEILARCFVIPTSKETKMNAFYNLKIFSKLMISFLAVLSMTVFMGVFSIVQLANVNQSSTDMGLNWMPSMRVTQNMDVNISNFRIAELQHILSTDEAEMAHYEKNMDRILLTFEKNRADYVKLISSPEEQQLYEKFHKNWNDYLAEDKKVLALSRANKNDEAKALIRGNSKIQYDQASKDLLALVNLNVEGGNAASARGDVLYDHSLLWIIALLLGVVALGMALAVFIGRIVCRPLEQAVIIARTVAEGDLTSVINPASKDETGQLMQALKDMNDSLVRIVGQVRTGTDTIATASSQIAAGNLDLSSRTEQQASSLEETASSMEELTSTVKQNADNARQANQLAASASEVALKGGAVVSEVVATMGLINASSRKIVDIISVIDGIAFQTNILALNAAVEAARAGEQGRGFAVVATEVRNLAQRSATAAKEIKALIGDSVEKIDAGTRLADEAGATMDDVVQRARSVTDIMGEITAASQEQTSGIEQINQAVAQMDQVTQQNAALVEEAAAAAEALQDQAGNLAQIVGFFKLDGRQGATPSAAVARKPAPGPAAARVHPAPSKPPAKRITATAKASSDDWEEF